MVATLSQEFHKQLCNYGNEGEMDFFDFVRVAMFASSVKHLYGEVSPKTKVVNDVIDGLDSQLTPSPSPSPTFPLVPVFQFASSM